jgi:hypothetical protein
MNAKTLTLKTRTTYFVFGILAATFFTSVYTALAVNYVTPGLTLDPGADFPVLCVDPLNDCTTEVLRIGNPVGNATSGSIPFVDASGNFAEDNTALFWDETNDRLGLGDITPDDILNISSATGDAGIAITSLGTDTDPYIKFELTDGTPSFTMGVDDSDSDSFKLVQGSSFAGPSLFEIATSGVGVGLSQFSDPEAMLHLETGTLRIDTYDGTYALPTSIELNRAIGDPSSMGPLSAGEIIGEINFNGHDTVDFVNGASLGAVTTETWTPTTRGTDLVFYGTDIGVATPSELMRLTGGGRLGIGTAVPEYELSIVQETQNVELTGDAYGGAKVVFGGRSANGTIALPGPSITGDILAEFAGIGHDGTSFASSSTASIRMIAGETFASGEYGTDIVFRTTAVDNNVLQTRMLIDADGNIGINDNSPLSLFTVGANDAFQVGSTGDIILNQATPQLTIDNDSTLNIVNEDGDNLFSLTDYNNVFGSAAESGAFVDRQSFFGEEFSRDRTSLAADGSQTWGDFQAWGVDETNNCAWEVVDDTINGIGRMRTNAAGVGNSCLTYKSAAAGNAHLEYNVSNLPVIYMKAKAFGSVGATDIFWVGIGDSAAGSTTAPNNGIFFTNNGGANWVGVTRSASTQTNTACGVAVSTTNFALLKIEVLSSTSVRFSIDANVSDGVSFTTCGTSATNIPATTLAAMIKSTSNANNVGVDVDYFRVWQDDNESATNEIVLDSAPTEAEYKEWLEEKVDDYEGEGNALEELSSKLADGFAWVEEYIFNRITVLVGIFDRIESRRVETEELCVGEVCVTEEEFMKVFNEVESPAEDIVVPEVDVPPDIDVPADDIPEELDPLPVDGEEPALEEVPMEDEQTPAEEEPVDEEPPQEEIPPETEGV